MAELYGPEGEDAEFVELESGLLVPGDAVPPPRPVGFDLFCGCGGFSLGMVQAGFEVIGACDNDPSAAITYLHNLGAYPLELHFVAETDRDRMERALQREFKRNEKRGVEPVFVSGSNRQPGWGPGVRHFWLGDASQLRGADILQAVGMERGELDCVFGGPPCQGFSRAGKQVVGDARNNLVFEFCRLVLELQPKTMAMENVPGLLDMVTPDGFPVVDCITRALEDGGFGHAKALKRALLASAGAGAAFRSKAPKPTARGKVVATTATAENQEIKTLLGLFGVDHG